MKEFFRKIKEKLFPEPDFDLEDDEDLEHVDGGVEAENVEEGEHEDIDMAEVEDVQGPEIAAKKGSKLLVVAASSLLITLVIYFFFIKESPKPRQDLEAVAPVKIVPRNVAKSEDGKSPFEFDDVKPQIESDIALLDKPKAPEVPELPEITDDLKKDVKIADDLFVDEVKKKKEEDVKRIGDLPSEPIAESLPVADIQVQSGGPGKRPTATVPVDPRYAPIIVMHGNGARVPSGAGVGYDDNIKVLNGDPINKLQKSDIGVQASFVEDRSNVVAQGKIINAVLETAINTEAPGSVRAVISRDVYGEAGNKVLVPRGSRLYGSYSTDTARGQARVQINWTRLIRPDGVDLKISSFASDQFGRAGIAGIVDNKYSQVITQSLLTSFLAVAGVAASEALVGDNSNTTTTVDPNNGTSTVTGRASTQAVYDVSRSITDTASRLVNEYFDARPTITVPQGTRITVLVNADIRAPSITR